MEKLHFLLCRDKLIFHGFKIHDTPLIFTMGAIHTAKYKFQVEMTPVTGSAEYSLKNVTGSGDSSNYEILLWCM